MKRFGSLLACSLLTSAFVLAPGCKSSEDVPVGQTGVSDTNSTLTDSGASGSGTDDTGDEGESGEMTCAELDCGGNGVGIEDPMSETGECICECDFGYITSTADGSCVVDTDCFGVREVDCRTSVEEGSGVGMLFSLEYCSGDPKTDLDIEEVILEEKQGEDWEELLPSESSATIIPRDPLHHIYLVVDVSQSIQDSGLLDELQAAITSFYNDVDAQGHPTKTAVFLFDGRYQLYPYVDDTDDFPAAIAGLSGLTSFDGEDPMSTNLYGAVINGIREIDGAQYKRKLASRRGLHTMGTVIIISDGDDEAGRFTLTDVENEMNTTTTNIVTVGLGPEDEFPTLLELGRDNRFFATSPDQIAGIFEDLATYIDETNKSTFFLGYCSPKRGETAQVRARFKDVTMTSMVEQEAICDIDATFFDDGCGSEVFDPAVACATRECSGLVGCGTCGAGQACVVDQCEDVSSRNFLALDELSNQQLWCESGLYTPISPNGGACLPGQGNEGEACDDTTPCSPPASYCVIPDGATAGTCTASLPDGSDCLIDTDCQSLLCTPDPNDPLATSKKCQVMPRYREACEYRCQDGFHCNAGSKICEPNQWAYTDCDTPNNPGYCRSGTCFEFPAGDVACVPGDKAFHDDSL